MLLSRPRSLVVALVLVVGCDTSKPAPAAVTEEKKADDDLDERLAERKAEEKAKAEAEIDKFGPASNLGAAAAAGGVVPKKPG